MELKKYSFRLPRLEIAHMGEMAPAKDYYLASEVDVRTQAMGKVLLKLHSLGMANKWNSVDSVDFRTEVENALKLGGFLP